MHALSGTGSLTLRALRGVLVLFVVALCTAATAVTAVTVQPQSPYRANPCPRSVPSLLRLVHHVPDDSSTIYIRPGALPPTVPRSACIGGFCAPPTGPNASGTFVGSTCGGTCPVRPVTPLSTLLAHFAAAWQHTTWTEEALPSAPVGDAVAVAKAMLGKYPGL